MLCKFGLKMTRPADRGGWQCYITNVIKEMAVAKCFENLRRPQRYAKAVEWAGILEWELQQVKPSWIFCVGGKAHFLVDRLQRRGRLPSLQGQHIHQITHYSARGSNVKERIIEDIRETGFPGGRE